MKRLNVLKKDILEAFGETAWNVFDENFNVEEVVEGEFIVYDRATSIVRVLFDSWYVTDVFLALVNHGHMAAELNLGH